MAKKRRKKKKTSSEKIVKRQNLGKGGERGKVYSLEDVFSGMQQALDTHDHDVIQILKEHIRIFEETDKFNDLHLPSFPKRFSTTDGKTWKFSLRMHNFMQHGVTCSQCKIEGQYFVAERFSTHEERPHLNLYARDKIGDEVLMTHDHIIPKSSKGPNTLENVTTMCTMCNTFKGNMVPSFVTMQPNLSWYTDCA